MSAAGTLPAETPPVAAPADWARPLAERQLAILGRLAEAGLEMAVALEAQARNLVQGRGGPVVVEGDIALAYDRVARAVRQTIMLQSNLVGALQERQAAEINRKAQAKSSAARLVRDVIEDDREIKSDKERLRRLKGEAAERLEAEDFGDLLSRPFGEAVAQICRDLGLSPDWLALAEDCAAAEAKLTAPPAAAPASAQTPGPIELTWVDPDWMEEARARDSS
jgi:hypothetical protein